MTKTKKTYNFLEAAISGKRFRPIDENTSWWFFDIHGQLKRYVIKDDETRNLELHKCDYGSVFELEEKSITITESEFDSRLDKIHYVMIAECRAELKKELGF